MNYFFIYYRYSLGIPLLFIFHSQLTGMLVAPYNNNTHQRKRSNETNQDTTLVETDTAIPLSTVPFTEYSDKKYRDRAISKDSTTSHHSQRPFLQRDSRDSRESIDSSDIEGNFITSHQQQQSCLCCKLTPRRLFCLSATSCCLSASTLTLLGVIAYKANQAGQNIAEFAGEAQTVMGELKTVLPDLGPVLSELKDILPKLAKLLDGTNNNQHLD